LNEDLGAVEYIFSDKTGTLTRNVMKLSKWHIGGRTFHELQYPGSLGQRMRDSTISDEEYDLLMAFCRNIAVCHSVLPCEDSKTGELLYEAQSPDESALLEALRDNGVVLKAKTKDSVTVEIFGLVTETYTVLKVLEFTSDRKCMSVIIDTPQGIQLFCKGADNVILSKADTVENDPLMMRQMDSTVRRFSIAGLRTLMLAWRPLSPEEYRIFDEAYSKAECHIGDGEDGTQDREELIRAACEPIEGRLRLLGCTAIEDRLQDQVPETIEYLMDADIKIWLLTGDKQETAINIGISSRLISPAMKILVLNVKVERDCRLVLEYFVEKIKERERDEERYWQQYQEHPTKDGLEVPEKDRYALVVNGESLAFVLGNEIFEDMFLRIGTNCHSVREKE
jgi:magnesium-transporting ATPase (P-type)